MKKIHWSLLLILLLCIVIIGIIVVGTMFFNKPVPDSLLTAISSIIFALIGYSAGKDQ